MGKGGKKKTDISPEQLELNFPWIFSKDHPLNRSQYNKKNTKKN